MISNFILATEFFFIAVFAHILVLQIVSNRSFILIGYAILAAIEFSLLLLFYELKTIYDLFQICFTLIIFWNLYLIFLINVTNSVSISIILKILNSVDKKITYEDIVFVPFGRSYLETRLQLAIKSGLILSDENGLALTSKGKYLSSFIIYLRKFWVISKYG